MGPPRFPHSILIEPLNEARGFEGMIGWIYILDASAPKKEGAEQAGVPAGCPDQNEHPLFHWCYLIKQI